MIRTPRSVFIITLGLFFILASSFIRPAAANDEETLSREALQAYNASDYAKAMEKGREALAAAKKSGNRQAVGVVAWFLGEVHSALSEYREALGYYEDALAIQRGAGNENAVATVLNRIGAAYQELGRYDEALKSHEEALAITKETGNRQGIAETLKETGMAYSSLGRYEKALSLHQEALAIDREIGNRLGAGEDLAEIGIVYSYLAQYEKALGCFDEALAIEKEFGDRKGVGGDLAEIGMLYSAIGMDEKALAYLEQALEIHKEIGARKDVAGDLAEIGNVYSNLGRNGEALRNYEEGLAIDREIGDKNGVGKFFGSIGTVHLMLGRGDMALSYFQEALKIDKEVGDRGDSAINLTGIGMVYSSQGKHQDAYESLKESLRIGEEIGAPEVLWRALCKLGKASAMLGKDLEAASLYERAIDAIEAMRTGLSEKEVRIVFMSGKIFVYDELIGLYLKMHANDPSKGYDKKALEVFERKQGRVFLEEMGKSGARDFAGVPAEVKDREADLENRIEKAGAEIVTERSKGADKLDTARLQALEAGLRQLRTDLKTTREEIGAKYPDYYALKYPAPAGLDDIREKVLGADEALLVYAVMQDGACLWVIGKKRFGLYSIRVGENELAQKIDSFRKGTISILKTMTNSRNSRQQIEEKIEADMKAVSLEGLELHKLLIPDDAREAVAEVKTLYVIPSGPLYGLPFEALVSRTDAEGLHYLVEDHPVAYLSSASLLQTLREAEARKTTRARYPLLAFANPVYGKRETSAPTRGEPTVAALRESAYLDIMGGSFLELPETEDEAREIKTVLTASDSTEPLQLRQDASRSKVLKLNEARKLADYRYVVFSCHGVAPDVTNRVSQPALVLSQPDPAGGDGFLTMADTFGLRLNADLVTLSACNTGRGMEVRGEGVIGLTRAFMYAGANAVSVTIWSVESISAKLLSTGLYENLQANSGRAEALREIKLRMIHGEKGKTYRYPYFWAPVVLFGDGR
jgi:CHAT domain-containing protein/tetratricopeptide (TPR) repeat protein